VIDRRRSANVSMIALGVFMISLGQFAAWGPQDTLFTVTLARAGIEHFWGWVMIVTGAFKIASACGCLRWMDESTDWPRSSVVAHLVSGFVLLWTWVVTGLMYGLSTPTVHACAGVGFVLLAGGFVEARRSREIRNGRRSFA
jgi:uncharacterized membrane protein HdeD (DUF308 family)